MSQQLLRLRAVWNCVHEMRMDSDFTKALDEIIGLAFEPHTVSENGLDVKVSVLRDDYKSLMGDEPGVETVRACLLWAYDAYHADSTRPLPYDMYKMFVGACHGCGSLVNKRNMVKWYLETPEEHSTGGAKKASPQAEASAGAAVPVKDDAQTQENERLRELLRRLKKIVEEYERGV